MSLVFYEVGLAPDAPSGKQAWGYQSNGEEMTHSQSVGFRNHEALL